MIKQPQIETKFEFCARYRWTTLERAIDEAVNIEINQNHHLFFVQERKPAMVLLRRTGKYCQPFE